MNIAKKAGLTAGSLTIAVLLSACTMNASGSGSSSTASGSAAPSATAASSTSAPAASTAAPSASASGSGSSGSSGSGSSGSSAGGTGDDCTAPDLSIAAGAGGGPGAQSNGDAISQWNLTPSKNCSMDGYPGVDLIGINKDNGQQMRISVPRATDSSPSKVSVPGDGDDFGLGIEYLPASNSSFEFDATEMIITPPNTYDQLTYKFSSPWKISMSNEQINAHVEPITSGGHM